MTKFTGKGVSGKAALGYARILKKNDRTDKDDHADDIVKEKALFDEAKKIALLQLSDVYDRALKEIGEEKAQIFEAHKMLIADQEFDSKVRALIDKEGLTAYAAIDRVSGDLYKKFSEMDDDFFKERASDIEDVSERLKTILYSDGDDLSMHRKDEIDDEIICACDLTPSETMMLDKSRIVAFVTEKGTMDSHTAMIAKELNIPAVVGVGEGFLDNVSNEDKMIVNGLTGEVIIDPSDDDINNMPADKNESELIKKIRTTDVKLLANVGSIEGTEKAKAAGAKGIGLFRSEFLFFGRTSAPDENEQFEAYKKVLSIMNPHEVTIRTLDMGADKGVSYIDMGNEENPALGVRGIRLCLVNKELFKTQLRALYRASVYGNLKIMFPMISNVDEVKEARYIVNEVKEELRKDNIRFNDIEIGIMIETPAAALISDELAKVADFFSIGTNDLMQYTLAADRTNEKTESIRDRHHKAIFKLIGLTIKNAHENGIPVSICGDMASDVELTDIFIELGVDDLSVPVSSF